jgi:hypothetical protein
VRSRLPIVPNLLTIIQTGALHATACHLVLLSLTMARLRRPKALGDREPKKALL